MKNNVMPSIVQIEANTLQQLVQEVKETVATDVKTSKQPVFGAVDLWNVNRKKKTARLASYRNF
ncbi:MAG: hypothetical protein JO301_06360 [Chitinophagaceae bacterium]|nr:hypothetical protein [Chitinophagaceae bacterium]